MWFGVVELLEKERILEEVSHKMREAYITPQQRTQIELKALRNVRYKATVEIEECGVDPIEYIELDGDTIEMIKNDSHNGPFYYNAIRTLWLTQYLLSIKQMDQELQELAQVRDNESFIQEMDNLSDDSDVSYGGKFIQSSML